MGAMTFEQMPQAMEVLLTKMERIEQYFKIIDGIDEAPEIMNLEEAAAFLRMKESTLYSKIKDIPHSKSGKRLTFLKKRLIEWVESQQKQTEQEDFAERDMNLSRNLKK